MTERKSIARFLHLPHWISKNRLTELAICEQNLQIHVEKRATSTNSFHTLCAAQNLQIHLEEMAIFFSSCKIWIFHGYILALKLAFLQKFLNQKVQFSTNIMTKQKNLFAKMVRILQIHLISLKIEKLSFLKKPYKYLIYHLISDPYSVLHYFFWSIRN